MIRTAAEILQDAASREMRRALIVTALPIEMKAVRAHLKDLGSCTGRGGTIYECGQFTGQGDEWLVVVAESGAGTHPAQSVVTYAHYEFGTFEVLLFVGIGASRKPEVPIGSVVASSYVYLPYSGKYSPSGFTSRPHSLQIDERLIGLAKKIQRDEEWPDRIRPPLKGKLPALCDYPQPFPPAALIAPIVSVEAVSANPDSELEKLITQNCGDAHALDMEGYGAVFAANREQTPSMVIRGISDMRGGKDPELDLIHQPVAAVHAAAFGFELLNAWGQSYRPVPKVGGLRPDLSPAQEPLSAPVSGPDDGSAVKCTLVLNFEGSAEDYSPEKIAELVEVLRRATGNPAIRVVGSEPGSFRLLIEAGLGDLTKINSNPVRQKLATEHGVELLGAVNEGEYRAVQGIAEQFQSASRALLDWPQCLPDGTWIDRPEIEQLLRIIDETEYSTTAVLGLPGSGKSALLAAFGDRVIKRGIPLLAIKADSLDPSIQSEEDLRFCLGLDATPSELLSRIAEFRPVLLLIDQLDALAGYVDLNTRRLSVLLNLVRKLGTARNIHIVLSARTFEYEHDVRLKAIKAESLTLNLPPWNTVLQLLETQGVQAMGWPTDAQEVLRSPQALATFLKLQNRAATPPFHTYQAMLDQVWRERILQRPDGPRLSRLVTTIAERMAKKETLRLATARFEDQLGDLDALIASGILTPYDSFDGSVGFSHQTLFEHALARSFAQEEGRLSTYVLKRQASLFVRPKLWAALAYLRDVEPSTYEKEVQTIWSAQNLRLHLRHLFIEFLGQQAAPSDIEALIMERAIKSDDRKVAFQAIAGSAGWFDRFANSYIGPAMVESAPMANLAAGILERAWSFAPDQVVSLIQMRWMPAPTFDGQTWGVLQGCSHWTDDVVRLATTILGRTEISSFMLDHTVATVGVDQPEAAVKLVLAALDRGFEIAKVEAQRRAALPTPESEEARWSFLIQNSPSEPLNRLIEGVHGWDSLEALAKANPKVFLHTLWPWFQRIFAALRGLEDDSRVYPGFPLAFVGDFRFEGEHSLGLPDPPLLGALRAAAESFASGDEAGFLGWLAANEQEAATPAQRLFAHTLASLADRYASRALAFLLGDHNRLHIGSIEDYAGTAKRLVKSVSPFWTDEELRRFEQTILMYTPSPRRELDAKKRRYFQKYIRKVKLGLLSSLPADRISTDVQRYITEERRRFPDDRVGAKFTGATFVGSPMAVQSFSRATDDDILNAFRVLPDATAWHHPRSWHVGGNIQLSREFANFAKGSPDRAARIIRRFEPIFGTRASGYALDAMAETADPKVILDLVLMLHDRGFDGEEFRGSVARAIERLVRRDTIIDNSVVTILEGWLAKPAPPESDEEGDSTTKSDQVEPAPAPEGQDGQTAVSTKEEEIGGSVLWTSGGYSVVPHGNFPTLETLTRIFLARAEHDRLLKLLRDHLARLEEPEVWQSLLHFLVYLRPTSLDELEEFLTLLFKRYPDLLETREAAYLFAYAQWKIPDFVHSMVAQWRVSERPLVQQAYGELVAFIAIVQPQLVWPGGLLQELVESDSFARSRVGAAYSAVNLWNEINRRTAASNLLQVLIPRADKRMWVAIFDLFRIVEEVTPERDWASLLKVLAEHIHQAGGLSSTFIVEKLQTLLPHEALLVAEIARGLVSNWRDELGDVRTGIAVSAPELVDLAITLHRLGPETRDIGTSLFEDLLQISAYSARQTLDEIDNRFNEVQRPVRRRLPRRSAVRTRVKKPS